ncbi:MAG: PAS domain-containing protein, partial [Myxococcota bacterium]
CDYCNQPWYAFLGDAVRGTLGERWTAAIHPDDFEACRNAYMTAIAEHRDYRWEFRLRRHDGVYRWVLSFGAPRSAADGSFGGYVGMCVDITEQREAKQRADEALARLDRAVAATEKGIWEWNMRTGAVYASPRLFEMVGREEAPIGDAIAEFRGAADADDVRRCTPIVERAIRERLGYTIEFRLRLGSSSARCGQMRWFRAQGRGTYDQDGRAVYVTGSMADITQERESEHTLREAVERYETLAKLAPVGIFRTAADGACLYVNDRWCEMAGMTQEEAAGDGWVRAVHPEDREQTSAAWYAAAGQGQEYYNENRFLRPDGSAVRLVARSHALKDAGGRVTGHLGTCTDVTALKEAEEQLRVALHRQATAAGRENLLRRELDHRVRNNLASLLGLIRLSEESSLDRKSTIDRLRTAVRTMNDSHELISRAHGEPVRLDLLLGQLLRGVTSRGPGRVTATGTGVRVSPERVNALAMTLQELATNSVKHGALSGPAGRIDIRWRDDPEHPGRVRLEWRETCVQGSIAPAEGTGLALVRTLVAIDLEGTARFEFADGTMACVIDFFPGAGACPVSVANGAVHT